ncbi:hypothetical protein NON20_11170 [Synechocystis sp. B12]|nr:hypothetical protein NON20_11170 [Synechocystis sp. B12]
MATVSLDRQLAQPHLTSIFPDLQRVKKTELLRHKPGRRALIAYHLETDGGKGLFLAKFVLKVQITKAMAVNRRYGKTGSMGKVKMDYRCQNLWALLNSGRCGSNDGFPVNLRQNY